MCAEQTSKSASPPLDGNLAHRLGGVRHEKHAPGAGYFRNAFHGLDRARLVVRPHHGNEYRVVAQGVFKRAKVDLSGRIHGQAGDFVSVALQRAVRLKDGPVFGPYRNEAASFGRVHFRYALDGRIGALGSPGSENDFPRLHMQGGGHAFPGLFASLLRGPAQGMAFAGRIAVLLAKPGQHSLQDPFVHGRGRIVIEVNDFLHGRAERSSLAGPSDDRAGDECGIEKDGIL